MFRVDVVAVLTAGVDDPYPSIIDHDPRSVIVPVSALSIRYLTLLRELVIRGRSRTQYYFFVQVLGVSVPDGTGDVRDPAVEGGSWFFWMMFVEPDVNRLRVDHLLDASPVL
jgi:hypothetical protein